MIIFTVRGSTSAFLGLFFFLEGPLPLQIAMSSVVVDGTVLAAVESPCVTVVEGLMVVKIGTLGEDMTE